MLTFNLRGPALEGRRSILLASLVLVTLTAAIKFPSAQLYESFLDTDDALRIVLVRQLLAGQPWFENIVPRALPPHGLDIHWSRLVDGGIAALILMFRTMMSPAGAEAAARFAWPLLWLVPAVIAVLSMARRLGGSAAVIVALLLLFLNPPNFVQFIPGRIDHHNVQIALTLIATACLIFSDRGRWAAAGAGLASGAVLGIGFEALPFALLTAAAMGIWWVIVPGRQQHLRSYVLALCVSAVGMHVAQTAPAHWLGTACDALAWNVVAAVLAGGIWILLASFSARLSHARSNRLLALAGAAGLATACFLILRPNCVRGPLADVDPRLWPLFLDHVEEMKPFWTILKFSWLEVTAYWTPFFGLATLVMMLWNAERRAQPQWVIILTFALVTTTLGVLHVRMSSYAVWFAVPAIAGAAAQVRWIRDRALVPSIVAVLLASSLLPAVLVASLETPRSVSRSCSPQTDVRALAGLEPGLVFAHLNLGSAILANTPHSIVVAPYHQMTEGFIAFHEIMEGTPAAAYRRIGELGVQYLAMCVPQKVQEANNLPTLLANGEIPEWLDLVQEDGELRIYRVRRARGGSLVSR
ncbi:hypothetical protein AA309_13080 [Microvirga vignae]|uniref:Glycosyltransferase RgtA/B/C/D-like domain-containing protein n=1 Tax=Microvirga vignae TaxID=1225564 RepID=A0A0H1RJ35_9HYPH|nr:hypothetical protein [Microvirga vignae]KLK92627.1 hypothetical protein AA309_13080 [Microvirga vignae]